MYTDITDLENLNKTLAKKDARVYLPRGPLSHEEDSLWGLFKDVPAEKTDMALETFYKLKGFFGENTDIPNGTKTFAAIDAREEKIVSTLIATAYQSGTEISPKYEQALADKMKDYKIDQYGAFHSNAFSDFGSYLGERLKTGTQYQTGTSADEHSGAYVADLEAGLLSVTMLCENLQTRLEQPEIKNAPNVYNHIKGYIVESFRQISEQLNKKQAFAATNYLISDKTLKRLGNMVKAEAVSARREKDLKLHDEAFYLPAKDVLDTVNKAMVMRNIEQEFVEDNLRNIADMYSHKKVHFQGAEGLAASLAKVDTADISKETLQYMTERAPEIPNYLPDYVLEDDQSAFSRLRIAKRKEEILARRSKIKGDDDKISGAVINDKIAKAKIDGIINEDITPEKGNQLAAAIRRKMLQNVK